MNIQYYYNFVTIVESGSLTAAAEKLHIAQPALSNQIKALEQKYGTRLFYRGARKLELTDAGAILYQKAKFLCEVEIEAKNEISSGFSGQRGTLRLGISYSISNPLLTRYISEFCKKYPETDVKLIEGEPNELMKQLQNGIVEAVIIRALKISDDNFATLYRADDELVAAYLPGSGFLDNIKGDKVTVEQLSTVPLSVQDRSASAITSLFKDLGTSCHIRFSSSRLQICMHWPREGLGVALVPRTVLRELDYLDLDSKKVVGAKINVPSVMVIAQKKYRSPVIDNFLGMLEKNWKVEFEGK